MDTLKIQYIIISLTVIHKVEEQALFITKYYDL